jgi:hypothetical protein
MRKREVVGVRWEVRHRRNGALYCMVRRWEAGGLASLEDARKWSLADLATSRKNAPHADLCLVRITRYRLAPLVEVSGWRTLIGAHVECGDGVAGGFYNANGRFCAWATLPSGLRAVLSDNGGRPEAEAALAMLGYRVRKGEG